MVQTGQSSLDRLLAVDGHPLNAKEQQGERERSGTLLYIAREKSRDVMHLLTDTENTKHVLIWKVDRDHRSVRPAGA